jgi:hypothetical protein
MCDCNQSKLERENWWCLDCRFEWIRKTDATLRGVKTKLISKWKGHQGSVYPPAINYLAFQQPASAGLPNVTSRFHDPYMINVCPCGNRIFNASLPGGPFPCSERRTESLLKYSVTIFKEIWLTLRCSIARYGSCTKYPNCVTTCCSGARSMRYLFKAAFVHTGGHQGRKKANTGSRSSFRYVS